MNKEDLHREETEGKEMHKLVKGLSKNSKHKPTVKQLNKMIEDLTNKVKEQEETIKEQKDELMFYYDDSFNGRNDYRREGYEDAKEHYHHILTLIKQANDNECYDLVAYILKKEMPEGTYSDEFIENPFREDADVCLDCNPFCENGSCNTCRRTELLHEDLEDEFEEEIDNPFR